MGLTSAEPANLTGKLETAMEWSSAEPAVLTGTIAAAMALRKPKDHIL